MLRVAIALEQRDAFECDGARNAEDWLTLRLNIDLSTAREWMEVARALENLPEISSVFESGRISWDQARQVVKIATPETDREWSERVLLHNGCSS